MRRIIRETVTYRQAIRSLLGAGSVLLSTLPLLANAEEVLLEHEGIQLRAGSDSG
ncbi:MAG: hypothetical protein R3E95_06640 [Thiolinea sp.]